MANAQSSANVETQIQSAKPPPVMEYVNLYTDDAVKRGVAPKPPPPITGTYQMFGQTCHQDDVIIRPLETQGIRRLHPEKYDKREEMKKLTVSILCNFLDLLDILVKCGVSPGRDEKIEDLNLLFIHMHHLINEFRPHQARETLKVMMSMQQKSLKEAGERLHKHMEKASEILKQCSEEVADLLSKHKHASEDLLNATQPMNIDELFSSSLSSFAHGNSRDESSGQENFDSLQSDKDMILCDLLDSVKE